MILGVDHVALSCEDAVKTAHTFEKEGYRLKFIEKDALNDKAKKRFLNVYNPLHTLAFCQGKTGPGIELTQHGEVLADHLSPYEVSYGKAGVKQIALSVSDISASQTFWCDGIGFKPRARLTKALAGGQKRRLSLQAPVPAWSLDLVLVGGNFKKKDLPMLDWAGFSCLAFLSTNIKEDGRKLKEKGAVESSGEFCVDVNGKKLRAAVFRGPSAELVELIEIARRERGCSKN